MIAFLERFADRPWYFPLLSLISAADLFIIFVPNEGLLVSSVLLQPKKWVRAFLWVSFGSAVGSVALAFVAHYYGETLMHFISKDAISSPSWVRTQHFLDRHGSLSVALIALSPIPLQPAVVLSGLAKMPLLSVFFSVFSARALKFGILSWIATHAPHLLRKIGIVIPEFKEIEAEVAAHLAEKK